MKKIGRLSYGGFDAQVMPSKFIKNSILYMICRGEMGESQEKAILQWGKVS